MPLPEGLRLIAGALVLALGLWYAWSRNKPKRPPLVPVRRCYSCGNPYLEIESDALYGARYCGRKCEDAARWERGRT